MQVEVVVVGKVLLCKYLSCFMKFVSKIFLTFFLISCATEKFNLAEKEKLNSKWKGKTFSDLIEEMGKPKFVISDSGVDYSPIFGYTVIEQQAKTYKSYSYIDKKEIIKKIPEKKVDYLFFVDSCWIVKVEKLKKKYFTQNTFYKKSDFELLYPTLEKW